MELSSDPGTQRLQGPGKRGNTARAESRVLLLQSKAKVCGSESGNPTRVGVCPVLGSETKPA